MSDIDCDSAAEAASHEYQIDLLNEEIARLRAEADANRVDAERYRWLRDRLLSANFEPDDCVELSFALPSGSTVSASLDNTIDAAMGADA